MLVIVRTRINIRSVIRPNDEVKFIFGFSVVLFIACLVLLIRNFVEKFDWITLVVAVLGIINASLIIWTSQLLKRVKG